MLNKTQTWEYITKEKDLIAAAKDLNDYCKIFENKNRKPKLTHDQETYSKTGRHKPILLSDGSYESEVRLFGVGLDPSIEDAQYIFDVDRLGYSLISETFKNFFEGRCLIIGQGLKFDASHLIERFKIFPQNLRDTLLLDQIIQAGDKLNKNLDRRSAKLHYLYKYYFDWDLFEKLTGMTPEQYSFFKENMQASNWANPILSHDQLTYHAQDNQLVQYLYTAMVAELERIITKYNKPGLRHTYRIECAAIPEVAIAEIVGIEPDLKIYDEEVVPYLENYVKEAEDSLTTFSEFWEEQENLTTQIKLMSGDVIKICHRKMSIPYCKFINVNGKATAAGPGQLQRALERAGIPAPNSQRETFEEMLYDPDNSTKLSEKQKMILNKVLQYLKAKSMLTKYGKNMYEGDKSALYDDGCFHPDIFQMGGEENGVDTQRMSIKNPPLQTIPSGEEDIFNDGKPIGKVMRSPYRARRGKKWIVADFSNQEVRLATQLTKDPYLTSVFLENRDQHSETAKEILFLDYLPKKGSPERAAGKVGFLGHQYQQGWKGMQAKVYEATKCKLWLSDDQAKKMKEALKSKYQGITDKSEECRKDVLEMVENYTSLKYFENRKPIFIGFTQMKYNADLLKDIIDLGDGKVPITRMRRWCLYKEQEIRIKRAKRGLVDFKLRKRSVKKFINLCKKHLTIKEDGTIIKPAVMKFSKFRTDFIRRIKAVDTLHKDYKVYDEETEKYSTWNNERNKRISAICREYFNFLIQPEGSTIVKLSLIGIMKEFRIRGWDYRQAAVLLMVHDELIVECLESIAEEAAKIVNDVMERVMKSVVTIIPTPVTVGIGDGWDAK